MFVVVSVCETPDNAPTMHHHSGAPMLNVSKLRPFVPQIIRRWPGTIVNSVHTQFWSIEAFSSQKDVNTFDIPRFLPEF